MWVWLGAVCLLQQFRLTSHGFETLKSKILLQAEITYSNSATSANYILVHLSVNPFLHSEQATQPQLPMLTKLLRFPC